MKRTTLIVFLLSSIVICDQTAKLIAREFLRGTAPRSFLNNFFVLEYAENPGAFLSLGARLSERFRFWLFIVFVSGFVIWATWHVFKHSLSRIETISWSLIIGGSVGNLIDRLTYGKVIDFLHIGFGSLRTGIFNIADFAIVVGLLFIMVPGTKRLGKV